MNTKMYAGPGGNRGVFGAWDTVAGRMAWSIKENFPVWSGAAVTAGDVVFYGTMDGYFKAVHARTGEALWQFKVGSGIIDQPVTYKGPDGKQYVAILSGVGGWSGAIVAAGLDPRDPTAALGFANAMSDLPEYTTKGACARHQLTFQMHYINPALVNLGLQARAAGAQFDDDQNRFRLERYFTLDALASRRIARHFELFIAAENLLDKNYEIGRTPVTTVGPPLFVRIGLRLRFGAQ